MNGFSKDNPLNHVLTKKKYKVFLVEEDDDLRERVLECVSSKVEIEAHYGESENFGFGPDFLVKTADALDGVTITIDVDRSPYGHYFRVTDFSKEEDETQD